MKTVSLWLEERGVLTHENGSHLSTSALCQKKKKSYCICFHQSHFWGKLTTEVNLRATEGTGLVKRLVETLPCCECMNITRPHMLAICFLQCHHRLLQRDSLILSFLYSSDRVFLENKLSTHRTGLFYIFAFGCWLTSRGQWVTSAGWACNILYEQIQLKSTSLPFLCFAIEYIKHCFPLSCSMTINYNIVFLWNYC